ncbi:MAG: HEPN domain-containing protein [Planctomycetes bacterium]|nr:HEPN domain-containing protein [Planctomycetota bacterium]
MKNSLEHLPQHKQAELEIIRDIILEKIPDLRMIILFGSYARGNWVEDTHIEGNATHVYQSDFDILVATKSQKAAEDHKVADTVEQNIHATGKVDTPISIIYHSFGYIAKMLNEGHYFFTDIQKEGIYLYKDNKHRLGSIKTVLPEQRKQAAEEYFNQWFENANEFLIDFNNAFERQSYNKAAFYLHQAAECFYSAVTLVFINYRFRTHDLDLLRRKSISYDSDFAKVFPRKTDRQRELFSLLRKAYVDARYKDSYEITKEQLEHLARCVEMLREQTKTSCEIKMESFAHP